MISAIFGAVGDAISSFATCVASAVTSVAGMFVTESSGTYSLTTLGTLLLIAVGVGLVFWAFRLIKGLVKRA